MTLGRGIAAVPAPWLPPRTVSAAPTITTIARATRRAVDAGSRDAELVGDLEQRDQRAPAQAHEQPRPAVDAEQAGVQDAVHEKPDQADQQAPEPDSRDRFAFAIERRAEGPGGAPHGAGAEREQVAGEACGLGPGVRGLGCHGAVVLVLMARKDRSPVAQ